MTVGVNEELALVEWLAGTPELNGSDGYLAADATLAGLVNGFFDDYRSTSVGMPIVRISPQDRFDALPNGSDRALTTVELLIRGITAGKDRETALAVSAAIDSRLSGSWNIATPYIMVAGGGRIESFWQRELVGSSDLYLHAGGVYRFAIHAL